MTAASLLIALLAIRLRVDIGGPAAPVMPSTKKSAIIRGSLSDMNDWPSFPDMR